MDALAYLKIVKKISIGKKLPTDTYLHRSATPLLSSDLQKLILDVQKIAGCTNWDLIKFSRKDFKISVLLYPDFFGYPYPELHKSFSVDLEKKSCSTRDYSGSSNPPILHRRESFLAPGDPHISEFSTFTAEGEALGLYEDTRRIGFKKQWLDLIQSKGHSLDSNGRLIVA